MRKFLTSESVTEGHPDKICDFVADSILDALLNEEIATTGKNPRGLRDLRIHRPRPHHGRDHQQGIPKF